MFKIKLLTSRVSTEKSYVPGDIVECENDEAWCMINDRLGELVGKKQPEKPQFMIEAEKKQAEEAAKEQGNLETNANNKEKEIDLIEREEALSELENEFAEREAALIEREKELEEKFLSVNENAQAK